MPNASSIHEMIQLKQIGKEITMRRKARQRQGFGFAYLVEAVEARVLLAATPTNVYISTPYPYPPGGMVNAQAILVWADVSGEQGYRVYRSPEGQNSWTPLGTDLEANTTTL